MVRQWADSRGMTAMHNCAVVVLCFVQGIEASRMAEEVALVRARERHWKDGRMHYRCARALEYQGNVSPILCAYTWAAGTHVA